MKKDAIISSGKSVISAEYEALKTLSEALDASFANAVNTIVNGKGRVIVTGIGKSALVAQKIVATFNSTGTPAIYMHAADAIHGDLGMIQPDDVVFAISKSGETAELKAMTPYLRHFGNTLISTTCNEKSELALHSDIHIYIPVSQEAEPNNLAPTNSTTAQMALGDALAITMLQIRGFSPEDFARYHPGGSLGKKMYLKAKDLAAKNERPVVHLNETLRSIIMEISRNRLGMTAVVDESGKVCGIITDGDIRRLFESSEDLSKLTAGEIMTESPRTISSDSLAVEVLEVMQKHAINQIIVLQDETYSGVIHIQDLLREGIF